MSMQSGRAQKHRGEIDLIRFVCSVLMVYYHLTPKLAVRFPKVELYAGLSQSNGAVGGIGVVCFFILSGLFFQLGHEWEKSSFEDFALKKIARLWPVMAFSILINCHTKADILNLFFISSGLGAITKGSSNPASWYACVLFWAFLIYYLCFRAHANFTPPLGGGGG